MATTFLSRTNTTGTSTQKGTISAWIKGSKEPSGNNQTVLASWGDANNHGALLWNGSDKIDAFDYQSGYASQLQTNALLRDSAAFYHIVYSWDTTLTTADDRQKIYINGVEQTYSTRTNYSLNATTSWNANSYSQRVGALNSSSYFSGLISYTAFVDGIAYTPTSFGETDSSSGIWKIKTSPSVTYGNNGFYLKMDTSSPGSDTSGENNTFTASGTPTLTQDNASNNLATLNPVYKSLSQPTFANGNLSSSASGAGYRLSFSTIAVSTGKYYAEFYRAVGSTDEVFIGISSLNDAENLFNVTNYYLGETAKGIGISSGNGSSYISGSATTYGSSYLGSGDIIGLALDLTNKKLYASKNGAWANGSGAWDSTTFDAAVGDIDISTIIPSGEYAYIGFSNTGTSTVDANFGNGFFGTTAVTSSNADAAGHGLFEYAVPTGFFTLNTKNLNTYG